MLTGMSQETFFRLQQVVVAGRPLNLSRSGAAPTKRPFTKERRQPPAKRPVHPTFAAKKPKSKKGKRFVAKA
jgi:hypothetical protein